ISESPEKVGEVADPFKSPEPAGALPRAASPFRPGPGKVPPAFGSRNAPLLIAKDMVDRLAVPNDPVAMPLLRGVRGVGKTALMAYTRHHAAATGTVALHIEADAADTDLTATCRSLLRGAGPLTSAVSDLRRRLSSLSLTRGEIAFHPAETDRGDVTLEALLYDLVLLAEHRGVGLLLTVDEVHEALDEPFTEHAGVRVTEPVADHVLADTGGYPYFVQLWGEALWSTLQERRDVRLADVPRAQQLVDQRREGFFSSRWQRFPRGRARDLAIAIDELGSPASMSAIATRLGHADQRPLSDARATLIAAGHLYAPRRGRVAFTVPCFDTWLVQRRD
ncbi:MAG: hypothetical protein WEB03_08870, partial [Nitriliruptor sp.]|uniref:hypothetical protein n=1 Tax=Nitriliruptor sp. TaxID=2448056 RepID=UPI0034A03DBF